MKLRLKDFISVMLDDSKLVIAEEKSDYIRMGLDVAFVGIPLRQRECENLIIYDCSLECFGVAINEKREWESREGRIVRRDWDDISLVKPANQSLPINEVSGHEIKNGFLVLGGYTKDKHWAAWRIAAERFELSWKKQEKFERISPPSAG